MGTPEGGFRMDIAAVEILRDRELGGPRFADFMEMVGMPRPKTMCDISPNPEVVATLDKVYNGVVDDVDTIVGLFAATEHQNLPGHIIVDSAYLIFNVQTPQRTWQDKFFVAKRTARYYTQWSIEYLKKTEFVDILNRHGIETEHHTSWHPFKL